MLQFKWRYSKANQKKIKLQYPRFSPNRFFKVLNHLKVIAIKRGLSKTGVPIDITLVIRSSSTQNIHQVEIRLNRKKARKLNQKIEPFLVPELICWSINKRGTNPIKIKGVKLPEAGQEIPNRIPESAANNMVCSLLNSIC